MKLNIQKQKQSVSSILRVPNISDFFKIIKIVNISNR